jgi:hypothetical protein
MDSHMAKPLDTAKLAELLEHVRGGVPVTPPSIATS